ncbi:MAG TPA: glutamate--tRNA ligase [Candidatus Magasanikbacteria bacterium]|nr:glutamate--tRNA ligase [Candidatus Magasanikbacteria bacterium]
MIKTRFAPSPTGMLHVGGLRTALFAYLFAKKNGGVFMLRIEDTDRERFVEGGIENITSSLQWAGITIDEGVVMNDDGTIAQKGNFGPYIQSERLSIYQTYIKELLDKGHAYYCFCTKEKLAQLREYQEKNKLPTGYDGTCRDLSLTEAHDRIAAGEKSVIRMKMPKEGVTVIEDLVRGRVEFKNSLVDDQVLIKADGFPTYHFAVVVDDHTMEVTHVIRGEEWLPSTPKHVELYKMFGWTAPTFAHLSLFVNAQKQKMSKRHGDVSVEDFKQKGYLPEALVNFVAFLGWNPGTEQEIFSLKELEAGFDFDKVSKAAAVFNVEKLNWYNKQYMMAMDTTELARRVAPFMLNHGLIKALPQSESELKDLAQIIELEKGRAATLAEFPEALGFIFAESLSYEPELLVWKKSTKESTREKLELLSEYLSQKSDQEWGREVLEKDTQAWIAEKGFGVGDVLWPMRTSLSGQKNSPGPFEIAAVLGKTRTLDRIAAGIAALT